MNLRQLFTIIFIGISLFSYAQQTQDLAGYWVYESVVQTHHKDSTKSQLIKDLYNDLYIHVKKNGNYSSQILNRQEKGQWTYTSEQAKLELRSTQGAIIEIKIIEVNPKELVIGLANEIFNLKKRNSYSLTSAEEDVKPVKKKKKKESKRKKKKS